MKTNPFLQVITFLVALSIFATGCNTASKEREATLDNATAKKEIEAANIEFMALVSKGDSVGLANYYAIDAKLIEPNAPAVTGRKNIQTSMAGIIKSGVAKVNLRAIDVWESKIY